MDRTLIEKNLNEIRIAEEENNRKELENMAKEYAKFLNDLEKLRGRKKIHYCFLATFRDICAVADEFINELKKDLPEYEVHNWNYYVYEFHFWLRLKKA